MDKELMQRENNGVAVALLWNNESKTTDIEIESAESWARFTVPSEKALDAFDHPFVYMPADRLSGFLAKAAS